MKSSKLIKTLFLVTFLAISALSFQSFAAAKLNLPANSHILFVQLAKSGQLIPDKSTNSYRLILSNNEPFISFFTDRPNRVTGLLSIKQFVALWNGQKDANLTPPNVAIESINLRDGSRINKVLELSNPVYDIKNQKIIYSAKSLNGQSLGSEPLSLGYTVLFIDDFTWSGNEIG